MRILELSCLVALTCALTGCGERETRVHANPETGENVTLRTGSAIAAPRNMPDFAPLYPGARIESVLEGNGSAGNRGGMVAFRTADSTGRVAAFYRDRLDASGLSERNDADMNGSLILTASATGDVDRGVQVTIAPTADAPGSYVTMTYNLGGG
ncbi:MAG: hypothetical protein KF910_09210 [Brevundimonas sp.]|uniref:hypothetical protein n=1 Tax=Brevundimonas sp. TaxID=1871086 RepID=UPI0025C44BD7|nr:hypothetical protein [Brevundimonas sp.]MBX3477775.1 hypothetical protein [Brevundimonas sp.]